MYKNVSFITIKMTFKKGTCFDKRNYAPQFFKDLCRLHSNNTRTRPDVGLPLFPEKKQVGVAIFFCL